MDRIHPYVPDRALGPLLASISGSLDHPPHALWLGFCQERKHQWIRKGEPQLWGGCWLHHSDFPTLHPHLRTIRTLTGMAWCHSARGVVL